MIDKYLHSINKHQIVENTLHQKTNVHKDYQIYMIKYKHKITNHYILSQVIEIENIILIMAKVINILIKIKNLIKV